MKGPDVRYFRDNLGYARIFRAILERYRSLGRMGGKVTLDHLSAQEREVLSNHLGRDFSHQKEVSFSVRDFERSLALTRFADYSLEEILAAYFQTKLISRKEESAAFQKERFRFFKTLEERYRGSSGGLWLEILSREQGIGLAKIHQLYAGSPSVLEEQIGLVVQALELLEKRKGKFWPLPVFASLVSGDPHAFDQGTDLGKLLVAALSTLAQAPSPGSGEELAEFLYQRGLLVNEILNFVTCAGLQAYQEGKLHPVWEAALNCAQPLQMPLYNLTGLTGVQSPSQRVYVLENPAVFATILTAFSQERLPALVCTAGQVKISGLILLDLLAQGGTKIYYSGDLDPEGLLIAQRLAKRYGQAFSYWRINETEYDRFLSQRKLSPRRLAKLQKIDDPRLIPLAQRMEKVGLAAYQELLLPDLIEDIRRWDRKCTEEGP